MESEIKLKLRDRQQANEIQHDEWFDDVAPHAPIVKTMRTEYLDTADGALRRQHAMFRLRYEGEERVYTLKMGTKRTDDGLFQHLEWNLTLDDALDDRLDEEWIQDVFMDMADGDGDDELYAVLKPIRNERLEPIAKATFERIAYDAFFGESLLEVAFDMGEIEGQNGRYEPILEVEIELKEGDVTDLIELGALFAETYGLIPEMRSKYERALALLG